MQAGARPPIAEASRDKRRQRRSGTGQERRHAIARAFKRALAFFKRTNGPSYISPRAFALVVLDNVAPSDGKKTLFDEGIDVLGELPDSLGTRLKPLVTDAQKDVERLRTNVEAWYDDTMARVSGWYKRKTQIILIVIGIVLVPAINANTIAMAERMWKDDTVRSAVVAQAQANASATPAPGASRSPTPPTTWTKSSRSGSRWGGAAPRCPHGASGSRDGDRRLDPDDPRDLARRAVLVRHLSRFSRLRSSGKPETPLPAAGSGKSNERILTPPQVPTVVIQHEVSPASGVDKPGHAEGG